jgi:Erythromycin esterase
MKVGRMKIFFRLAGIIAVGLIIIFYVSKKSSMNTDSYIYNQQNYPSANCKAALNDYRDEKIVNVGESMHGSESVWAFTICVSRYLIQNQGFKNIFLENEYTSTTKINAFVHGDNISLNSGSLLEMYGKFSLDNSKSLYEFLKWLRKYNLNLPKNQKISVYGLESINLNLIYTKILNLNRRLKRSKFDSEEALVLRKTVCTNKDVGNFYQYVSINVAYADECLIDLSKSKLAINDKESIGFLLFQFQLALKKNLSKLSRDTIMKTNFENLYRGQKSITITHSAHNFPGYDINNFASELSNKSQYSIIVSACSGKIMNFDYSKGKRFDLNLEEPRKDSVDYEICNRKTLTSKFQRIIGQGYSSEADKSEYYSIQKNIGHMIYLNKSNPLDPFFQVDRL